ncbi:MAG: DUF2442 domain-containing protein [bacterium]
MKVYPKVKTVKPQSDKRLLVTFDNGLRKLYDCKPLLTIDAFKPLQEEWMFKTVQRDAGGYGVSWCDEVVDLSESELWENGQLV